MSSNTSSSVVGREREAGGGGRSRRGGSGRAGKGEQRAGREGRSRRGEGGREEGGGQVDVIVGIRINHVRIIRRSIIYKSSIIFTIESNLLN